MTMPPFSRRQFLKTTTAAGAVAALAPFATRPLAAAQDAATVLPAGAPSWIGKTSRWAQLTLVEDDPGKYDLAFWLDYFQRTHSDAACISGGGCVAYYPT
ncbi:MAG: twin-arginine translocation signal domain-containing protein, partial [Candidatus Acidiferrales bacterium]